METAREEVEEVFEAAEAVWARRAESSRFKRFTCTQNGSIRKKTASLDVTAERKNSCIGPLQCLLALARARDVDPRLSKDEDDALALSTD
jgi:hypothetical protein